MASHPAYNILCCIMYFLKIRRNWKLVIWRNDLKKSMKLTRFVKILSRTHLISWLSVTVVVQMSLDGVYFFTQRKKINCSTRRYSKAVGIGFTWILLYTLGSWSYYWTKVYRNCGIKFEASILIDNILPSI